MRIVDVVLVVLVSILSGSACSTLATKKKKDPLTLCPPVDRRIAANEDQTPCRPYKTNFLVMAPDLDAEKPLGVSDKSGWAVVDDVLVGSVSDDWAVGFDMAAERPIWWKKLSSSLVTPISQFGKSSVVFGTRAGELLRIDVKTGKTLWSQKLGRFVSRKLTLNGSTLIAINVDQKVFGLDFETGDRRWVFDAGKPANLSLQGESRALVAGNQVFVGISDGRILSLDLRTGKLNWQFSPSYSAFRFKNVIQDMAVLDNKLLFSRYDGLVASLNIGSGQRRLLWETKLPAITSMKLRDEVLFLGGLNGEIYAYNANSGKKLWSQSFGETVVALSSGEKLLYAAGANGRIAAIHSRDGLILWHDDVEGSISREPIIWRDSLYFATGLRVLYGYKIF